MMRRAERPCPKAAAGRAKAAPSPQRSQTDFESACQPGLVLAIQRLAGNRATTQLIESGPPTSEQTGAFEALHAADPVVGVQRSCEHGRSHARVEPAGRAVEPVMLHRMVDEPGPSEGGPGAGEQAGLAAGSQVWPSGRTSEAIDQVEALLLRHGPGARAIVTTSAHRGDPMRQSLARNQNGQIIWTDRSDAEVTAPRDAAWGASLVIGADDTVVSSAGGATPRVPEAEEATRQAAQSNQQELDHEYGQLAGPKGGQAKPAELADGELRLNPMWYRLEDFPPKLLLERKKAIWLYSVGAGGEISVGVEKMEDVVEPQEWKKLFDGMRQKDPDLTELGHIQELLNDLGHPTIAAAFHPLGKTKLSPARVSGELRWEDENSRFVVSDKSGRYMSPKVREDVTQEQAERWLANVARRMSERLGVTVHPVVVKTG